MNRTAEFVLGLIGGIFGFIGAVLAIFIGGIDAAFSETGTSEVSGLGWLAFLFSILAVIGSVVVRNKAKAGGIMLIISAVGGLISISMFYLIPAVMIGIAGIMGLVRKDKQSKQQLSA